MGPTNMSAASLRALVAESTELGRWAIAHALQAEGFEIHVVADWAQSADWLNRAQFDVAILSLSCDRDDVGEIGAYLRRHSSRTGLILLALQDDIRAIREACGSEPVVLPKPLDVAAVVMAARSMTGRGSMAAEV